eukprot:SAG31_NODE_3915_length_3755_cov_1.358862_1_plen_31_part_00
MFPFPPTLVALDVAVDAAEVAWGQLVEVGP